MTRRPWELWAVFALLIAAWIGGFLAWGWG